MKRTYRFRYLILMADWALLLSVPFAFCYGPPMSLFDYCVGLVVVFLCLIGLTTKVEVDDAGIVYCMLLFIKKQIPWESAIRIRYGGLYTVLDYYTTKGESFVSTTGLDPRFFEDVLAHLKQSSILPEDSNQR